MLDKNIYNIQVFYMNLYFKFIYILKIYYFNIILLISINFMNNEIYR